MTSTPRQYVVDEHGERIAVLLPIAEYEQLDHRAQSSSSFWHTPTLQELAVEQGVEPITDPTVLLGDFWPSDESIDDFLAARRAWQHPDGSQRKADRG